MPTLLKSSSLENIKKQFVQDCLLTFSGYVFATDLKSQQYAEICCPIDKEGFPVPIQRAQCANLVTKMQEQYLLARTNFIERCSALEQRQMAQEKPQVADEHAE